MTTIYHHFFSIGGPSLFFPIFAFAFGCGFIEKFLGFGNKKEDRAKCETTSIADRWVEYNSKGIIFGRPGHLLSSSSHAFDRDVLQDRLQQKEDELADERNRNLDLLDKNAKLQSMVRQLKTDKLQHKGEMDQLRQEVNARELKIRSLKGHFHQAKKVIDGYKAQVLKFKEKFSVLNKQYDKLENQLEERGKEMAELRRQNGKYQAEIERRGKELEFMDEKNHSLRVQLRDQERLVQHARALSAKADQERKELERIIGERDLAIEDLREQLQQANEAKEQYVDSLKELKLKHKLLEEENERRHKQVEMFLNMRQGVIRDLLRTDAEVAAVREYYRRQREEMLERSITPQSWLAGFRRDV